MPVKLKEHGHLKLAFAAGGAAHLGPRFLGIAQRSESVLRRLIAPGAVRDDDGLPWWGSAPGR